MSAPGEDVSRGVWLDLGEDASVVLPAAALAAANLTPGNRVMIKVVDGVVQVFSHTALAMEMQRLIDKGIDPGAALNALPGVDGLIVERRLENLQEEREFGASHHAAE